MTAKGLFYSVILFLVCVMLIFITKAGSYDLIAGMFIGGALVYIGAFIGYIIEV